MNTIWVHENENAWRTFWQSHNIATSFIIWLPYLWEPKTGRKWHSQERKYVQNLGNFQSEGILLNCLRILLILATNWCQKSAFIYLTLSLLCIIRICQNSLWLVRYFHSCAFIYKWIKNLLGSRDIFKFLFTNVYSTSLYILFIINCGKILGKSW